MNVGECPKNQREAFTSFMMRPLEKESNKEAYYGRGVILKISAERRFSRRRGAVGDGAFACR